MVQLQFNVGLTTDILINLEMNGRVVHQEHKGNLSNGMCNCLGKENLSWGGLREMGLMQMFYLMGRLLTNEPSYKRLGAVLDN